MLDALALARQQLLTTAIGVVVVNPLRFVTRLVHLVRGISTVHNTVAHSIPRNASSDVASNTVTCSCFSHWLRLPICDA